MAACANALSPLVRAAETTLLIDQLNTCMRCTTLIPSPDVVCSRAYVPWWQAAVSLARGSSTLLMIAELK